MAVLCFTFLKSGLLYLATVLYQQISDRRMLGSPTGQPGLDQGLIYSQKGQKWQQVHFPCYSKTKNHKDAWHLYREIIGGISLQSQTTQTTLLQASQKKLSFCPPDTKAFYLHPFRKDQQLLKLHAVWKATLMSQWATIS